MPKDGPQTTLDDRITAIEFMIRDLYKNNLYLVLSDAQRIRSQQNLAREIDQSSLSDAQKQAVYHLLSKMTGMADF